MLGWFLAGSLIIGYVDQIEEGIATVEYQLGEKVIYREVLIDTNRCVPIEGQQVLFDNKKIITCFCAAEQK